MLNGSAIDLRFLRIHEVDAWVAAKNNQHLMGEFSGASLVSPAQLHSEFAQNGLSTDDMETLAIVNKFDQMIGTVCHFPASGYSNAREIGVSIFAAESRGKGFATEAVALLSRYLFDTKPINRLQMVMPLNHSACEKVALKCGYKHEGVMRGLMFIRGHYSDCLLYALLRSDMELLKKSAINQSWSVD